MCVVNCSQFLLLLVVECAPVENEQIDCRYTDVGVGQVEYRSKEIVVVVHQKIEPRWHVVPLEEWEVEHIDHLTHQH